MIPLSDDLKRDHFSLGVMVIIILNLLIWVIQSTNSETYLLSMGFTPAELSPFPFRSTLKMISATFLHGGWFHLIGNSLFLFVFGRSIENRIGTIKFLTLYPFLGIVGFLFHWIIYTTSDIPVVGASAAISALMGAYLVLFPKAGVHFALILGWFIRVFTVPAWLLILYWIGLQVISFYSSFEDANSVAYVAHIGGFLSGVILGLIWKVIVEDNREFSYKKLI